MAEHSESTPLPPESPYSVLFEAVRSHAPEDDLRIVLFYDSGSVDVLYRREDLLGEEMHPPIDAITGESPDTTNRLIENAGEGYGDLETSIGVYEGAVIVNFHGGTDEGMVVAVDRSPDVLERLLDW